ncbi:MAG: hypothetical protein HKM28_04820 [Flavobacteriaceae bacterium]|nr:hypothetical protein [Flavobacteriaceae bacterium]
MKKIKLLFGLSFIVVLFSACSVDVITDEYEVIDPAPSITLAELVGSYDLWYVDIERTSGSGYIPFMQKAFTLSFQNGAFFANNNLVGIGSQGNGYGIDVGFYDTFDFE